MDWKAVDEVAASFAFLEDVTLNFESDEDQKKFVEGGFMEQMGHFYLAENVSTTDEWSWPEHELVLRPR